MNLRRDIDQAVASSLQQLISNSSYRRYAAEWSAQLSSELGRLAGSAEALLFSSATAGLEICLRAAGLTAGSTVAISAYDYPGNFWAIERTGARPLLIDIEPNSWSMNAASLMDTLSSSGAQAVIVSHLHGELHDLTKLREICDGQGILLIEDACQSVGTLLSTRGDGCTSALAGHLGLISFGGGKVLSGGRGGAVLGVDEALIQKIRIASGAGSGPYAMSELQAATVLAQLPWLKKIDAQCCHFFGAFASKLLGSTSGFTLPWIKSANEKFVENSFYQAGIICPDSTIATKCLQTLVENGCPAGSGFSGFHRRSTRRCDHASTLLNTASVVERTIVLHHDVALSEDITPANLAELVHESVQET